VALWALGFVRASLRARTGGCGSGSSLTYGYAGIGDSSKLCHLLKSIKTTESDVFKTHVMASPPLRDDFASTVELCFTFIKKMKAENPQLNVSEGSFAHGKGVKNSFGNLRSSGISNFSNASVDDSFFEKHEYHALMPNRKMHFISDA
jgi:hypothetical protein